MSLVSSVGDSIDGVEKVIRAPEIGSVPDLNPGPKPTGLSKDSLMRRANVAAALRTLRSDENTKLTNLRLAPDRIDATLLTDEGRLRHVQIQPGGELERFGSDSGPGFDNVSTIPFAKLNPGAPQRLARRGAREHGVPISELQYAVPQDVSDGLRWVVYFTRGRYVIGNAGRPLRARLPLAEPLEPAAVVAHPADLREVARLARPRARSAAASAAGGPRRRARPAPRRRPRRPRGRAPRAACPARPPARA